MQLTYERAIDAIASNPRTWLITGTAGFIGSHLLEKLLLSGQTVVALDSLITGRAQNYDAVKASVGDEAWERCTIIEGSIEDPEVCNKACAGVDLILHQAALGSVPRSIQDPAASFSHNVLGFHNMLVAARENGIRRFVYASSSSVYGDSEELPKVEERTGNPLSPYAQTKASNEDFAKIFGRVYGMETLGLRYFNVFGPRQDPNGPYAAVVPRWADALLQGREVAIFGDGETSRDFTYVANAVQANILAGVTGNKDAFNTVFNVGCGERATLNQLYRWMRTYLDIKVPDFHSLEPAYKPFRPGDIRHSHADISKAKNILGYAPTHTLQPGLKETLRAYLKEAGISTG